MSVSNRGEGWVLWDYRTAGIKGVYSISGDGFADFVGSDEKMGCGDGVLFLCLLKTLGCFKRFVIADFNMFICLKELTNKSG